MTFIIKSNTIFDTFLGLSNPLNTMMSLIGFQELLKLIAWAKTNLFKRNRLCVGVLQKDPYYAYHLMQNFILSPNMVFTKSYAHAFYRKSIF